LPGGPVLASSLSAFIFPKPFFSSLPDACTLSPVPFSLFDWSLTTGHFFPCRGAALLCGLWLAAFFFQNPEALFFYKSLATNH